MNTRILSILLIMLAGVLLPTAVTRSLLSAQTHLPQVEEGVTAVMDDPLPEGLPVNTAWHRGDGIFGPYHLGIFGPNICTHYGDPFSPLNSPWAPGPYTYQFLITVPSDYPYNELRVELFDPDSINAPNQTIYMIPRTNAAILQGMEPITTTTSCPGGNAQRDPCLIATGELELYEDGSLPLDQINPQYIWRVDENRGTGPAPGNGTCGYPSFYDANYNTSTHFELYYFQDDNGSLTRTSLATYTGQTGDGTRDNGDHQTDRYWVSPGAPASFDELAVVPVDTGSPATFQIDLTSDTPNITTDPNTGDRTVYLDVTTLSGASENGFDIWAGPPSYINVVPSEVNARNLYVLNTPGSHSSHGVEVTAIKNLPLNSNLSIPVDIPLLYIGPEYAGQTFNVGLFDSDGGAQPPITFFFDTIAEADWSLTYGQNGVPDPDGQTRNCLPGSCNNQWITPTYPITIPGNIENCDFGDPDDIDCLPFYGGWLTARYTGGSEDTTGWEITGPTTPPPSFDPRDGCTAFPIAVSEEAISVSAPGTGSNPYPDASAFDYPSPPPAYTDFADHTPDTPLSAAATGDVFKVEVGSGSGDFSFLVWNEYVNSTVNTLQGSLTWPGNSHDYVTIAAGATPPGFAHPVYGFIEAVDATDTAMHIGDWVAAFSGAANSTGIRNVLNGHIDNGRILRLPVWGDYSAGGNGRYQISGFALFRLVGYRLSTGGGGPWLLFEFMGHDTSCGQTDVALTAVTITGPSQGLTNTFYAFTATVSPLFATTPVTYVWEIEGQEAFTHTGGISDTITMGWEMEGSYELQVTTVNAAGGPVTDTHTIRIGLDEKLLFLPLIFQETTPLN